MTPSLQDLRRIFYGADEDGSVSDAEWEFLQTAAADGISALDLLALVIEGMAANNISVDSSGYLVANGDDAQEVLAELDAAIDAGLSGGLAAVSTTDTSEFDFSGNGTPGTPLSASLLDVSADKVSDGATKKAYTAAEKTKLAGVATGATANDTDANLKNRANHTGTQSADTLTDGATNKAFLATERTKLAGVATGATANDTDANLKNRANHTGTQSADTLTDGATNKAFLATERTKLAGIATGATANDTDANLKNRANHTGSQATSTITGLDAALLLKEPYLHTLNSRVASYTLVLTDADKKVVEMSNAGANTLTVPTNASVAFAVGTEILVIQTGAGATTIAPFDGTVTLRALRGILTIPGQYGWAKLIKRATNEWLVDVHGFPAYPKELARAVTATAQTGITTVTDLNSLSVSFTVGLYPVEVELEVPWIFSATSSLNGSIEIYDTPGATTKRYGLFTCAASGSQAYAKTTERITTPGSYTRKGRISRSSGTGTISVASAGIEAVSGGHIRAYEVAT